MKGRPRRIDYGALDSAILGGMTWRQYEAAVGAGAVSLPTWRARKQELIAQGRLLRGQAPLDERQAHQPSKAGVKTTGSSGLGADSGWATLCATIEQHARRLDLFPRACAGVLEVPAADKDICIVPVLTRHILSWASHMDTFTRVTSDIASTPNLFVCIVGDLLGMEGDLRVNLGGPGAMLQPGARHELVDAWLRQIDHKVLFIAHPAPLTEDNRRPFRDRPLRNRFLALDPVVRAINVELVLGEQRYAVTVTERYSGNRFPTAAHLCAERIRLEGRDCDVVVAPTSGSAGACQYTECGRRSLIVGCSGSLHPRWLGPEMPCFTLSPTEHRTGAFASLDAWLATRRNS